MIKLPESLGIVKYSSNQMKYIEWSAVHWTHVLDAGDKLYKEAQLKQALRDFGERCAQVAGPEDSYQDEHFKAKADSVQRIRALIKEITE